MAFNGKVLMHGQLSSELLPVPAVDDTDPVPQSPEESFVMIQPSADSSDFSNSSMPAEQQQMLQEEVELCLSSSQPLKFCLSSNGASQEIVNGGLSKILVEGKGDIHSESISTPFQISEILETKVPDVEQSVLSAIPPLQLQQEINQEDNEIISIVSCSVEDCSEDILTKMEQLIDENLHLKDTIIQNNKSMQAQCETVVSWNIEVERVHEIHKKQFQDAKNIIAQLKNDGACLRQENDRLHVQLEMLLIEHDKTKQILVKSTENNTKEFELEAANKKIRDLEEALDNFKSCNDKIVAELEQKVHLLNTEKENKSERVEELEAALEKMNLNNNKQSEYEEVKRNELEQKLVEYEKELEKAYINISALKENVSGKDLNLDVQMTKEKLLLSEMANERFSDEIRSLRNQLAKSFQIANDLTKLQHDLDETILERDQFVAQLDTTKLNLIASRSELDNLQLELKRANVLLEQAQNDVEEIKRREDQAKFEAYTFKQQFQELEQKYAYSNNHDVTSLRQQLMNSQKALTDAEQRRAVAEATLSILRNENGQLRQELENKQTENDTVFALKAQLELYKIDFEAEQAAKEDIKRDKNKIADDLQQLHRRNQQLQDEIEELRLRLSQGGVLNVQRNSGNDRSDAQGREGGFIVCPKCHFKFDDLKTAERHVLRCLEIDDSLP